MNIYNKKDTELLQANNGLYESGNDRENAERLKILFEHAPDAYYLNDLKGNFVDSNKAAEVLSGYSREELIGKSFLKLSLLPKNQIIKASRLLAKNTLGKSTGPDQFQLCRKDGSRVAVEITTHPVRINNQTIVLSIARDVNERRQAEQAERNHRDNLTFLAESAMTFLVLPPNWDIFSHIANTISKVVDGVVAVVISEYSSDLSKAFVRAVEGLGKKMDIVKNIIGQDPCFITGPISDVCRTSFKGYKLRKIESDLHALTGGIVSRSVIETIEKTLNIGEIFGMGLMREERIFGNILVFMKRGSTAPSTSLLETYVSQASVALERRLAEEQIQASLKEKIVLLKEIHHRVKNNLQIVSSLLGLQSHYTSDPQAQEMFMVSRDRIRSMAFVHEQLYRSENFTKINFENYLRNLTQKLIKLYKTGSKEINLKIDVENIDLGIDIAVPCGLIVNELITNAIKHAFPSSFKDQCVIQVSLNRRENGQVELIVRDNGIGMPQASDSSEADSLGMKLVNILAEDQLKGSIEKKSQNGTMFKISFYEEPR